MNGKIFVNNYELWMNFSIKFTIIQQIKEKQQRKY